jgi:hypothetical protein
VALAAALAAYKEALNFACDEAGPWHHRDRPPPQDAPGYPLNDFALAQEISPNSTAPTSSFNSTSITAR